LAATQAELQQAVELIDAQLATRTAELERALDLARQAAQSTSLPPEGREAAGNAAAATEALLAEVAQIAASRRVTLANAVQHLEGLQRELRLGS
jgi:hypothetical protein